MNELELASVLQDLHRDWEAHPGQRKIIQAIFRDALRVVQADCGRKFGKTEILIYVLCRWALMRPGEYYYIAPQQKQAREIIWISQRLQLFLPKHRIAHVNNTEMRVTLTNGSSIKLDGSDNHQAYRGINPHGIVYDEFKDFRPEFHEAMGPNLATHKAQLFIAGTPPDESELPEDEDVVGRMAQMHQYDAMKMTCETRDDHAYFTFPSWTNPHIDKSWLRAEKAILFARGEDIVWYREYEARRIPGGRRNIFPMFRMEEHVYPHEELLEKIRQDRHKMHWYACADPGTSTCFAVLFSGVNPYTQEVYHLDEIYVRDQMKTSTATIIPMVRRIREDLYPGWTDWYQLYDEAAAWFYTEAVTSFGESFLPTHKHKYDKLQGLSLIKDQLLYQKVYISDRCKFLPWELENHRSDDHGKPEKKNDHLIDCFRYVNEAAHISLAEVREPHKAKPNRRGYSLEEDWNRLQDERGLEISGFPAFMDLEDLEWSDEQ